MAKTTHAKLEKERLKNSEDWQKDREKKLKKGRSVDPDEKNPFEETFTTVQLSPNGSIDPNQNVTFTFSEPLASVDTARIRFSRKVDSLFLPEPFVFRPVPGQLRQYRLYAEWEPEQKYRFEADSLAFLSVMGHRVRSLNNDLRVRSLDEYGSIFVRLVGIDTADTADYVVQLLNKSDKPVAWQKADRDGRADFFYLKPSDYYMRLFVDRNRNGLWDTGDYQTLSAPEEVHYFPRSIPLKAKFELQQDWNFRSIAPASQKPKEITKQKADREKTVKDKNRQREEQKRKGK